MNPETVIERGLPLVTGWVELAGYAPSPGIVGL